MIQPGIHEGVSYDDYDAEPGIRASLLKRFRHSPAEAAPGYPQKAPTPAMRLGIAIHAMALLGPDYFDANVAVMEPCECDSRSKKHAAMVEEFESLNVGKLILPNKYDGQDTADVLVGCAMSLKSHPLAAPILAGATRETTLIWTDPKTELRCKARLDANTDQRAIVELKSTADIDRFVWTAQDLGYDLAGGHYLNGAQACGMDADTVIFLIVEPKRPYRSTVWVLPENWQKWGQDEAKRLLGLYKECQEKNYWPAYKLPATLKSLDELEPHLLKEEWATPYQRMSE